MPTFGDFSQTETNSTNVKAEWTLTSNGIRPLLQMVVRWRDGQESIDPTQFPPENNVIFDFVEDVQEDGVRLSHSFKDLKPATRYAVLVEGRNYVGLSETSFAMETGESLDGQDFDIYEASGWGWGVENVSPPKVKLLATSITGEFDT